MCNDKINSLKRYIKEHKDIAIPLILFFVTFLVVNFLAPHQSHDSDWIRIFNKYGGLSWNSFGKLISDWFYTHNSRLPIEMLAILFVQHPVGIILFRLINPIFATIVFYLILKSINSNNIIINILLYLISFTISGTLIYECGLASCCSNYIWPLALATPALLIVINSYRIKDYKPSNKFFALSITLLVVYALWSEMLSLLFFLIVLLFLILNYTINKRINKKYIVYMSLATIFFIFALSVPSNKARYESTVKSYFPTYPSFTFFSKCWFGVVETYNDYMKIFNLIFVLILAYAVFSNKRSNKLLKINSLIPILHFIIYNSLFNDYVLNHNSGISSFYTKYICVIHKTWSSVKLSVTGVPFLGAFFGIMFFASILISLLFLKMEKDKKIILVSCYLIGLLSKFCLGFTPRYYVTYRTSFYVVISTLIQIGIILNLINKNYKIRETKK